MKYIETDINGLYRIEHDVFYDNRGCFLEASNTTSLKNSPIGQLNFVQDNMSYSKKGVLRGLHFQLPPHEQGKQVRVIYGEVYDVVADFRKDSSTYGQWTSFILNDKKKDSLYLPPGMAHGFLIMSEEAILSIKITNNHYTKTKSVAWNDPTLNIKWPVEPTIFSEMDEKETIPFKDL